MKFPISILLAGLLGAAASVHAEAPVVRARGGASVNGTQVDAAGGRRVFADGQGNVDAAAGSTVTTANGGSASRSARFTRNANGSASGERNTSATNAKTGVTYNGTTTYTQGEGISRSAGCTDASGSTVTCGSAR